MSYTENKTYKGVPYTVTTMHFQETMNFGYDQTLCECQINGQTKIGSERQIKLFITKKHKQQ